MKTETITSTNNENPSEGPQSTREWLTDSTPVELHPLAVAFYVVLAILALAWVVSKASAAPPDELRLSFYGQRDTAVVIDDIRPEGERLLAVIENRTSGALFAKITCDPMPGESLKGGTSGIVPVPANSAVTVDLAPSGPDGDPLSDSVTTATGCSVRWSDAAETGTLGIDDQTGGATRSFDRESSGLIDVRLGR